MITGTNSQYKDISDLKGTTIGISRYGRYVANLHFSRACNQINLAHPVEARPWHMSWHSSKAGRLAICPSRVCIHTPAHVLIYQPRTRLTGVISAAVNNDIRGLINSVNDGSTSAFMWEWFTTKPFADAGECRFVRLPLFSPMISPGLPSNYRRIGTLTNALLAGLADRLGAHALAVLAHRCAPDARACRSPAPLPRDAL